MKRYFRKIIILIWHYHKLAWENEMFMDILVKNEKGRALWWLKEGPAIALGLGMWHRYVLTEQLLFHSYISLSPQILSFIPSILYPIENFAPCHQKTIHYSYIHAISSFILKYYISQATDKILGIALWYEICQTQNSSCNRFTLQKKLCAC